MIDFEQEMEKLKKAMSSGKELLETSMNSLNSLQSMVLQNKDKFSDESLVEFEKAQKEVEEKMNELKRKYGA